MQKLFKKIIYIFILAVFPCLAAAQQVNTLYFMNNVPLRHSLNPSFQPTEHLYISLPMIGFIQMSVGNNALAVKDVVYRNNNRTISFLDSAGGNIDKFYHTLHSSNVLSTGLEVNLLSFGFKHKTAFWSFGLTERFQSFISIPKDAFQLALYGTPDLFNNRFNLTNLQTDESLYTEAALGYAKTLNKKWSVGAKLKYLFGTANFSNRNTSIQLNAGVDQWTLSGVGTANYSGPASVAISNNFKSRTIQWPQNISDWLKQSGSGAGIDLGATYKANTDLTLSAALIDLGFIRWKKNALNVNYATNFVFDGVLEIINGTSTNTINGVTGVNSFGVYVADSIVSALDSASTYTRSNKSYSTSTPATLNLGAEYNLLGTKLTVGLLSRTQVYKKTLLEELTVSLNAKPTDWFNTSISTSLFEGKFSSIGAGVGLRTGFVHWLLAADYIPFQFSSYQGIPVPYTTQTFNFSLGINLVFDQIEHKIGLQKQSNKRDCNCL